MGGLTGAAPMTGSRAQVALKVYSNYARAAGGLWYMSLVAVMYAVSQANRMLIDWWFAVWVQADLTQEEAEGSGCA